MLQMVVSCTVIISVLIVILTDNLGFLRFRHSVYANQFPVINSSASFDFYFRYLYDYNYGLVRVEGKILKVFKDGKPWDNSSYSSVGLPLYFGRYFSFTFAPATLTDLGIYRFDVQIRPSYSLEKIVISQLSLYERLEIRGVIETLDFFLLSFIFSFTFAEIISKCRLYESRFQSTAGAVLLRLIQSSTFDSNLA